MKPTTAALLIVAIAAGATALERLPFVRGTISVWLAASALPKNPEIVTVIEIPPGRMIAPLDAALTLRAVLRYSPKIVAFLDPIVPGSDDSMLVSKLSEAKIPVVFTANSGLVPLSSVEAAATVPDLPKLGPIFQPSSPAGGAVPVVRDRVSLVARQNNRPVASNVWQASMTIDGVTVADGTIPGWITAGKIYAPVSADGTATINRAATRYVKRVELGDLMVRTERSEQGEIGTTLDGLFRDRVVTVELAGGNRSVGLAAVRNNLAESDPPNGIGALAVLIAATLPWWRAIRRDRALFAVMATCGWLLLALAIYQEWRMPPPLLAMLLLPALALIPRGSGKHR